jgi:hypothetical protein
MLISMHNYVFLRCTTATTSMLHENRNRKQLQILAKHSGSCSYAAQQTTSFPGRQSEEPGYEVAQQNVDNAYSVKKN